MKEISVFILSNFFYNNLLEASLFLAALIALIFGATLNPALLSHLSRGRLILFLGGCNLTCSVPHSESIKISLLAVAVVGLFVSD